MKRQLKERIRQEGDAIEIVTKKLKPSSKLPMLVFNGPKRFLDLEKEGFVHMFPMPEHIYKTLIVGTSSSGQPQDVLEISGFSPGVFYVANCIFNLKKTKDLKYSEMARKSSTRSIVLELYKLISTCLKFHEGFYLANSLISAIGEKTFLDLHKFLKNEDVLPSEAFGSITKMDTIIPIHVASNLLIRESDVLEASNTLKTFISTKRLKEVVASIKEVGMKHGFVRHHLPLLFVACNGKVFRDSIEEIDFSGFSMAKLNCYLQKFKGLAKYPHTLEAIKRRIIACNPDANY